MITHNADLKSNGSIHMKEYASCGKWVATPERPTPGHQFTSGWRGVNCAACIATVNPEPVAESAPRVVDHDSGYNHGPEFPHDCEECVHLDTVEGEQTHDIYYHPGGIGTGNPTIVVRRGPEGPDYFSGMAFATKEPLIALGLVIALKRGLIRYEDALKRL